METKQKKKKKLKRSGAHTSLATGIYEPFFTYLRDTSQYDSNRSYLPHHVW